MVEHEAHFTKEPEPARMSPVSIKPRTVGLIMLIVVLLGPVMALFGVGHYGLDWQIVALTWAYSSSSHDYNMPSFYNPFQYFMTLIPFFFLRIVFAFQMWRFYQGKTTKMYTAIIGFASDIQFQATLIGMGILALLFNPQPGVELSHFLPPYIPIPLLLLSGFFIYKVFPTREAIGPWKGLEEKEQ
jgi:hypothetical protein